MMSKEVGLLGPEDTFVVEEDKTSRAVTFKDQVQVMLVLFRSGGEDEDVIDVGDAEEAIADGCEETSFCK